MNLQAIRYFKCNRGLQQVQPSHKLGFCLSFPLHPLCSLLSLCPLSYVTRILTLGSAVWMMTEKLVVACSGAVKKLVGKVVVMTKQMTAGMAGQDPVTFNQCINCVE